MEYLLEDVIEEIVFGLRCPDGSVIWPPETYKGYEFDTVEKRNAFPSILASAAAELRVDPAVWVSAFAWVSAITTTTVVSKIFDEAVEMGHVWPVPETPVIDGEPLPPDS